MKIIGIEFAWPTLLVAFRLLLACIIVTLFIYGVRVSIDDGSVKNMTEVLRHLMFWPFSIVLAIRIAHAFGLALNSFPKKIFMVFIIYIPVGAILAIIGGVIPW